MTISNSQLLVARSNIKLKNEVKYLGIVIDKKLTFETQVKSALKNGPWHKNNSNSSQQPTQKMCCFMLLSSVILNIVTFF